VSLQGLVGPEGRLSQLSAVSSDPGSPIQLRHCDTEMVHSEEDTALPIHCCWTALVALQVLLSPLLATPWTTRLVDGWSSRTLPCACFQDITADMGPTLVWGATHTRQFHRLAPHEKACLLDEMPPHAAVMRQGEALLYNSLVFHCGGANLSQARRTLMSVSFTHPGATIQGTTDSILDSYRGQYSLADLRAAPLCPSKVPEIYL